MEPKAWHEFFNLDDYEVAGFGRTWWDVIGQAADRLGVPPARRRRNRPTGFKVLKQGSPEIYADDSPDELWVVLDAKKLQARPLMSHASWGRDTPWVLLWRRGAAYRS